MTDSYFRRIGADSFRATDFTTGAWSTSEQHIAPMNGLATHLIEQFVAGRGGDDLALARMTIDILGVLAIDEFQVSLEVVRPGRTIELLELVVHQFGRPAVRYRAWRLIRQDTTAVAGGTPEPLPHPDLVAHSQISSIWPGKYIGTLDVRRVREPVPGRGTTWVSTPALLLDDEPTSEMARYIGLVDTANGVAVRESPRESLFPNVDMTIHLYREPVGHWVGLDTSVVFGAAGQGLTSSVLHDVQGPVGTAQQCLTIRPGPEYRG